MTLFLALATLAAWFPLSAFASGDEMPLLAQSDDRGYMAVYGPQWLADINTSENGNVGAVVLPQTDSNGNKVESYTFDAYTATPWTDADAERLGYVTVKPGTDALTLEANGDPLQSLFIHWDATVIDTDLTTDDGSPNTELCYRIHGSSLGDETGYCNAWKTAPGPIFLYRSMKTDAAAHTLTFDPNGGAMTAPTTQKVNDGDKPVLLQSSLRIFGIVAIITVVRGCFWNGQISSQGGGRRTHASFRCGVQADRRRWGCPLRAHPRRSEGVRPA